jgi:hypothetical protein
MGKLFVGSMWLLLVWISTHIYKSDVMWKLYYDVESWWWFLTHTKGIM